MERSLFKIIRNQADYPNISILLPVSKSLPGRRQDAMILKKLSGEARQRLVSEFDKKDIRPLLSKLDRAVSSVDLTQGLNGLAIFVNSRFEMVVRLPFTVKERLVIDTFFSTRDLIRGINKGINYYILFASESFVRLFEANRDNLSEINEGGFPFVNPLTRNPVIKDIGSKEIRQREFSAVVGETFCRVYNQHPMKLIIAGTESNISIFRKIKWGEVLFANLEDVHDKTLPNEVAKLIWPLVKNSMEERRIQVLAWLNEAISQKRMVSGIKDVWESAARAMGELLLVEEDYTSETMISINGNIISIDELIDEIAEKVVSTGGKVVFTENGSLQGYNHIALVLKQA
jgi:hypothetical protein